MGKRSRLDIIQDMLETLKKAGGSVKPTHMLYKANLSHKQMKGYLEELEGAGCIERVKEKKRTKLAITEKGYAYAQKIKEMREFEKGFGI